MAPLRTQVGRAGGSTDMTLLPSSSYKGLFGQRKHNNGAAILTRTGMASDDETDDVKKTTRKRSTSIKKGSFPSTYADSLEQNKTTGGLLRTLLLAVPLFCKFCIVLAIKFATDLVVYPFLFAYRLARQTKKRIKEKFFTKEEEPNGAAPPGEVADSGE